MSKIEALKKVAFENEEFDGCLILDAVNILYFAGFPGTAALLIPENGESLLLVYGVNYEQAKALGKDFQVSRIETGKDAIVAAIEKAGSLGAHNLAVDKLSAQSWLSLNKFAQKNNLSFRLRSDLVTGLRAVKDNEEISRIRKASELTSEGMRVVYESLRVGMKEYEVAAEVEYAMRKHGSWGTAFETSVASGPNSAYPHGGCSDRQIRAGELVVGDLGATYMHYCSDMTRTLVVGNVSDKQKRIHETVRVAQERAFERIRPGVTGKEVDAAARKYIETADFGEFFVHGLGHGLGLEVHEPPTLNRVSKDVLAPGNVVSDEPGIYMVGYGGIRIEDTVLVKENGAEKLTSGPLGLSLTD